MPLDDAVALRRLIDITSDELDLDTTARRILQLGVETFDLPLGIVSHIAGDLYTVRYIEGPEGAPPPGTTFSLEGTYCVHTLKADGPLGFHHVATSDIRDHPCYRAFGLESYLGAPVVVDGARFGTINFTSADPRKTPFTSTHITMVRNFATVLGTQLSRHLAERGRQASIHREQAIVESVVDGIVAFSTDGTVRSFNPGAERLFGHADGVGFPLERVLPSSMLGGGATNLLARLNREPDLLGHPLELEGLHADGRVLPIEAVFRLFDADGDTWFTGILRDISHRKAAERSKAAFISTVSHELRTPLTSIRGAIGLLQGGIGGELPPKAMELLGIAAKNTTRLLALINDILDIEKLAAGVVPFTLQPIEVSSLLARAVEASGTFAQDRGVEMVVDADLPKVEVSVDGRRFDQVMANLLSNAAKFSPDGARIDVGARRQDGGVCIFIADRGPGIDEAFRDQVFERFRQADDSDTRATSGTGLGLSIARHIVERHGGTLTFRDRDGGGTVFEVCLAVVEPVATGAGREGEPRVLVVEDDPHIASLISRILAQGNLDAEVAPTLEEARRLLGRRTYVAVTLDLTLPDGDGASLLELLRADPELRNLPVVVVSGQHEEGNVDLAHSPQVVDFVHKPLDPERLLRGLRPNDAGGEVDVLLVEDDPDVLSVLQALLQDHVALRTAKTLQEARQRLDEAMPTVVVLDLSLPDGLGSDLLPALRAAQVPTLVFSASEPGPAVRVGVEATLLKARTSNEELLDTVLRLTGLPDAST